MIESLVVVVAIAVIVVVVVVRVVDVSDILIAIPMNVCRSMSLKYFDRLDGKTLQELW